MNDEPTPAVESNPEKIAALLEHDRAVRHKHRPKSYAEAARQIRDHARPSETIPLGAESEEGGLPVSFAAEVGPVWA